MKARKKGTDNEWQEVIYAQLADTDILYKTEYLEFQHDTLSTELQTYGQIDEEKHWQDVRERAAIAAMQGILSDCKNEFTGSCINIVSNIVSKNATVLADALIEELKKK